MADGIIFADILVYIQNGKKDKQLSSLSDSALPFYAGPNFADKVETLYIQTRK